MFDKAAFVAEYNRRFSMMRREDSMINPVDAAVFYVLLANQNFLGPKGDVVEIGVLRGGTFALMSSGLQQQDKAYAIDVFDFYKGAPPYNDPEIFRQTMARMAPQAEASWMMVTADTTKADHRAAITERLGGGSRFIHVDGDHRLVHVLSDLSLARDLSREVDHALIVVDDTFRSSMPEVTEGLVYFLNERKEFAPFLITEQKTYLSRKEFHARYMDLIFASMRAHVVEDMRHLAGSECLIIPTVPDTISVNV